MKVKINTHGNPLPESHGEWVDLYTAEDIVLEPLDFKIISLGIAMELPAGYYAQVVPRSSTCKNFGVIMANSVGIIEHSYCGNDDIWGFPAVAIRHTEIPKGTRICQFRLVKQDLLSSSRSRISATRTAAAGAALELARRRSNGLGDEVSAECGAGF